MSVHGKFPTRDGVATGSANERTMLDKVGYDGIRTELREGPDGTITMLRTRGGHPEFTNRPNEQQSQKSVKCSGPYGFVDTGYNLAGIGDASSGTLQYLIDEMGAVEPPQKTKLRDNHAWKDGFHSNLPSNYSGLMRRLMQVEHAAVPLAERNDFSCTFARSNGLFVVPTTSVRWLIEIDDTGVYRIPLEFCKNIDSPWAEYLAYETSLFATYSHEEANRILSPYWRVKKIKRLEKVKISEAFPCYADGFSPWYPWCGWAFNYTGTKATIVLSRTHPTEPTWWQTALFDLTITGAGDDGVPSYVSIEESLTSPLATSINDYDDNYNAFIQAATTLPGVCATVGLFSVVGVGGLIHAPVFSFYEQGGAKQVYFFDTYAVSSGIETSGNYGSPVVVQVPRTGSWEITPIGSPPHEVPIDTANPAALIISAQSDMTGIFSESKNGTRGGWAGFSGTDLPAQNVDFTGTRTVSELFERESGWSNSFNGGAGGISLNHVSRLIFSDGAGAHSTGVLVPYSWQDNAVVVCRVTARVTGSGMHDQVVAHSSTLVLHGYDRESVAFAFSKSDYTSAYTLSGSWDQKVRHDGNYLYSRVGRGNSFFTECGAAAPGTVDWCEYTETPPGTFIPSHITGFWDFNQLTGYVVTGVRIWNDVDMTSLIAVSGVSESRPAESVLTRTMYVRVGGETKTFTFTDPAVHRVQKNGDVIRYWAGTSALGYRKFCSKEVNVKPSVFGVGSYGLAMRSLFGFIGVF